MSSTNYEINLLLKSAGFDEAKASLDHLGGSIDQWESTFSAGKATNKHS
jgi:hypothetical protein